MNIPLNINWQKILLHALNLVLLVAGLYILLYKPVKQFMQRRAESYQKQADEAAERTRQAEALYNEYDALLAGAKAEIRQKRAQEMSEAAEAARKLMEETKQQAGKLIAQAQESADRERARILEGVQGEISRMSMDATHRLLSRSLDEMYDAFLDAAETEGRGNDEKRA